MNLYKIIGVKKNATRDQIKNAYRDKARELHPDKGGDNEEFGIIAKAYHVLSDKENRERYDRTGVEVAVSFIEQKAQGLLQTMFNMCIDKIGVEGILTFNVIKRTKELLKTELDATIEQKKKVIERKKALEKITKRIKHKNKLNAFTLVIKHRIDQEDKKSKVISEQIEAVKIAQKMLKDYGFKFDIAKVMETGSTWTLLAR